MIPSMAGPGQERGPSRARATVLHLLDWSGLRGAARVCRRTLRQAGRQAVRRDQTLVSTYLAQADSPRLHIGCGPHLLQGWLNSDFEPRSRAVLRLDATRRFPLPSSTFDAVFSEHMIEHVPFAGGAAMLAEAFRVLKPGGRIRITTPDLAFLLALYGPAPTPLQQAYLEWSSRTFVRGAPPGDPVFVINNYVRDWGHQFIYDDRTLRRALADAGFTQLERRLLNDSGDPTLRGLENTDRMPEGFLQLESITLEAVKPMATPR
jgi:predicted SAM-dependent methyltransferase